MGMRIGIGQYCPGSSWLHRLDPRTKIACTLSVTIAVFFVQTPLQLAYALALAAALLASSRIPAGKVVASIRPLVAVLALLGLFNLFFVQGGDILLRLGPVRIWSLGLWDAVLYPLRFSVALLAGALLLLTTTPTQLTDAFDAALGPLSRIGLPGHELAMVFSLMLRFIPTIADEASTIVDAQTTRGGGWETGTAAERIRAIGPILIALLASSLRHASGLSRALDARCYEGGAGRTHWHPLRFHRLDAAAVLLAAAAAAGLALLA